MDLESIMTIFSIMFGLIIGSFLNVCIYRIPLKKSLIHPPSSCPQCGKFIKFYDNIPVISYLLLRGKCRICRAPISIRYPIVELVVGLLSLALFVRYGLSPMYFFSFLFVSSLVTISFIDLHHKIIPDIISLPGTLLGIIVSIFPFSQVSWLDSLIGANAELMDDIAPGAEGKAVLRGSVWTAHNVGDRQLDRGKRCTVEKVEGLKLFVR